MCGIVGYVGTREAAPILIDGIRRLEYRGYDSSGIGVIPRSGAAPACRKTQGKIQGLVSLLKKRKLPASTIGISHTRWATHGKPSRANAHPHADASGNFLLVHNGIIENYQDIKESLVKKGYRFVSETDTEAIVHLIADMYSGDLFAAVKKAVRQLKGSFALGIICHDHPGTLIGVRMGSPLIVGIGMREHFIASDVPAIANYTKKVMYLQDGCIAVLTKDAVRTFDFGGGAVRHTVDTVSFAAGSAEKDGFAHFMLKEIHEQPKVLAHMLSARVKSGHVNLEGLALTERRLRAVRSIVIVACGTAYHAGMVGKYVIERLAGVPTAVDVSSEFRYRQPIIDRKTLVIAISQSGETADTLAAVKEARQKGATVVAICNAVGSSLARESAGVLYTHAGPEIGVASTKAYTAQLMILYLFALKLGAVKKALTPRRKQKILKQLRRIPGLINDVLKEKHAIAHIAGAHSHFGCFLYLGRNINYPSALEGALKLKEISYIPAEGYAAGEMKHGPIALIDEYRAVVCITPQSDIYDKMISNIQEIRARNGKVIAIASATDEQITRYVKEVIFIPAIDDLFSPLLTVVAMQLLAYYIAVARGCDVDQPRNLAKSVTVE